MKKTRRAVTFRPISGHRFRVLIDGKPGAVVAAAAAKSYRLVIESRQTRKNLGDLPARKPEKPMIPQVKIDDNDYWRCTKCYAWNHAWGVGLKTCSSCGQIAMTKR